METSQAPMTDILSKPINYVAPTENQLQSAGANPKMMAAPIIPAPVAANAPAGGGPKTGVQNAFIPGPPPNPPPNMTTLPKPPPVPKSMAPPPLPAPASDDPETAAAIAAAVQDMPVEEELDPEEKRKQELLDDPGFAKFIKLYKMKVPILSILNQVRAVGAYREEDILLFVSEGDTARLRKMGAIP